MSLEGKDVGKFYEMMTAPTTKILDKWFESEPLKATLATDACIGAMISPNTPGSGYVLLHHVMGELDGVKGAWGYPEGGMGSVSNAIAKSAIQSGAEIVVDAEVEKIILPNSDQKQSSVLLKGGEMIQGKVVLSNVTPQKTYLEMMDKEVLPTHVRESIEKIGICVFYLFKSVNH
jgi:phytoene dehydrogenase-like protein